MKGPLCQDHAIHKLHFPEPTANSRSQAPNFWSHALVPNHTHSYTHFKRNSHPHELCEVKCSVCLFVWFLSRCLTLCKQYSSRYLTFWFCVLSVAQCVLFVGCLTCTPFLTLILPDVLDCCPSFIEKTLDCFCSVSALQFMMDYFDDNMGAAETLTDGMHLQHMVSWWENSSSGSLTWMPKLIFSPKHLPSLLML